MFDANTLVFAAFLSFVMSTVALSAHYAAHRTQPGLRNIVLSFALKACGLALIALRGRIADYASISLANLLVFAGFGLLWIGLAQLWEQPVRTIARWVVVTVAVGAVLIHLFAFTVPDLRMRILIAGTVVAITVFGALVSMVRALRAECPTEGVETPRYGLYLVIGALGTEFLLEIWRVLLWWRRDLPPTTDYTQAASPTFYVGLLFVVVLTAYAVIIMTSERLLAELKRLAWLDMLTGVLNRRAFNQNAEAVLGHARRSGEWVSLLLMDIDLFKRINDTLGHAAGDRALEVFAQVAPAGRRAQDIFARIGGEEFVLMLPDTDQAGARVVAEDIRQRVADTVVRRGDRAVRMTVSIGLVARAGGGLDLDDMLSAADRALYTAKACGRNRAFSEQDVDGGGQAGRSAGHPTAD
ncbi:hypothetical protein CCR80_09685 [Rhodothalassium salexigens]|uniref:diguanylate cyclase n=1 Tax=Rhodothalassium salexigens TaxID=1086 RepID=UPI001911D243|nr:hypothetical protein [Rhodothalassium salexigens]